MSEYPHRTESDGLVWACCESTIGPPCQHVAVHVDEPEGLPRFEVVVTLDTAHAQDVARMLGAELDRLMRERGIAGDVDMFNDDGDMIDNWTTR